MKSAILCLLTYFIVITTASYTINPTITTYEEHGECGSGGVCVYHNTEPQVVADTNGLFVTQAWFQFSTAAITSLPSSAVLTLTGCQNNCGCSATCQETGAGSGYNLTMFNASNSWTGSTLTGSTISCNSGCAALPTIYGSIGSSLNSASGIYTLDMTTFVKNAYNAGLSTFSMVLKGTTTQKENCYCSINANSGEPVLTLS